MPSKLIMPNVFTFVVVARISPFHPQNVAKHSSAGSAIWHSSTIFPPQYIHVKPNIKSNKFQDKMRNMQIHCSVSFSASQRSGASPSRWLVCFSFTRSLSALLCSFLSSLLDNIQSNPFPRCSRITSRAWLPFLPSGAACLDEVKVVLPPVLVH